MLRSLFQTNLQNVILPSEINPAILICLILPIFLVIALRMRFINRERKEMKERRKKKKKRFKSCSDSASILGLETDIISPKQNGPISFTIAEALGLKAQNQLQTGPKSRLTLGVALGPLGGKKDRKWICSMWKAVARMSCGNPTEALGGRSKPLISLMKEMDRAEEKKKRKRERRENEGLGMCHVCSQRSKNATLIPCGHAYCRVCSREIWINTRCCPICSAQIVEVLDTF